MKLCKVEGCSRKHRAKGYCVTHYGQLKKFGSITTLRNSLNLIMIDGNTAKVFLRNKDGAETSYALIDREDVTTVAPHIWHNEGSNGYAQSSEGLKMHRLILGLKVGDFADHINRNRLDNRKSNLRTVTKLQNAWNRSTQKNNTSGTAGVSWNNNEKKWLAHIRVDGKQIRIGSYHDKDKAIAARKEAEKKYWKF